MVNDLPHRVTRWALVAATLLALAAVAIAWLRWNPVFLGWAGALAAFAVAVAAGAAARGLNAPDDLREPREARGPSHVDPLPSPDGENSPEGKSFPEGENEVSRNGFFGRLWGVALGALAIMSAIPLVALSRKGRTTATAWSPGVRLVTPEGRALKADDLGIGGVATVFPEGKIGAPESATNLIRVRPEDVNGMPGHEGWAPAGNIAYSKVCTHAGCPVNIYRHASFQLYCPCHQSVFDVLEGARPVAGPATRALPQLALDVDADGYLIARGDFNAPVGPDDWYRNV